MQHVGTRKIPAPRLSCVIAWTEHQTLYHGRDPGTSRHCLPSGSASSGTIDAVPLSVNDLTIYVITQTTTKEYHFLDTPMGSIKGPIAAAGAVAIYLNHDYVTVLEHSTSAGGRIRFIFDAC